MNNTEFENNNELDEVNIEDINEDTEIVLVSEAIVAHSETGNISIGIQVSDTRPDFVKDPYFKVFNHKHEGKSTAVIRVSMMRPEFIYHRNTRTGKSDFKMKRWQIEEMTKLLKAPTIVNGVQYKSLWVYLLEYVIAYANGIGVKIDETAFRKLKMPEYNNELK